MPNVSAARAAFRNLHASGCFVLPNPWNVGTAKYLRHLGFQALATTSAGFAFSRGLPDAPWAVSRDEMLAHISDIVTATDLPVNADFQAGYAEDPEELGQNVRICAATGVAGLSIEDATGDRYRPLYEFDLAVDRIRAARMALDESGTGVLLTARAECYLVHHAEPLQESLRRICAYAEAGADVLYAPGITKSEEMLAIVSAVAPKPVNVLMSSNLGLRVSDLAEMGVRRISVGSSLARSAWTGFIHAASEIAEKGSFAGFEGMVPFGELNDFFETSSSSGDR
jgi:2-methylisocitrate lyase-like PEP mutase family enzyme